MLASEPVPIALDPSPISVGESDAPVVSALECTSSEIPFGLGCARIEDDRAIVRAPSEPLLWSVAGDWGLDVVVVAANALVITPLVPESTRSVFVTTIDGRGSVLESSVTLSTTPPTAHFVLSEIYPNPVGPEPEQEWIEICNDGLIPGSLAGLVLVDPGGETELPFAEVGPGSCVLVANETLDTSPDFDVAIPNEAMVVRVPKLGHAGLSNAGEPMLLKSANREVISAFSPGLRPKAGLSVQRVMLRAPDGDPNSFVVNAPTPGTPPGTLRTGRYD
jgi:hypothetical protein